MKTANSTGCIQRVVQTRTVGEARRNHLQPILHQINNFSLQAKTSRPSELLNNPYQTEILLGRIRKNVKRGMCFPSSVMLLVRIAISEGLACNILH